MPSNARDSPGRRACSDAWLPETMARQFESLAVWRRVSHKGVGRLGQARVYSISGETHSRHCWWLMLAVSFGTQHGWGRHSWPQPHRGVVAARGQAVAVRAERHYVHRAGVAGQRVAEGVADVGVPQPHRGVDATPRAGAHWRTCSGCSRRAAAPLVKDR